MKNKFEVLHFFPTFVTTIHVDENTDELKNYEGEFETIAHALSSQSKDLRVLEKYSKTRKILLDYFKKFSNEVLEYDNDYDITTSWFTKSSEGQFSTFHNHKNSFWSGVYYYGDYDDNSSNIEFSSPLAIYQQYELNVRNPNAVNSILSYIKPSSKSLILFPSYLAHRIGEHRSKITRHSLAFNIVPIGKYGEYDSSYDTNWFVSS